jgi:hypothetical protein
MKKILALSVVLISIYSFAFAQKPAITFKTKIHDFGTVKEEVGKVIYVFEFTNTGTADLVLTNVQASCGCTTPDWTKTPIAPGKKGVVNVTYTATGRPGPFNKTITIISNTEQIETLTIKGDVIKEPTN